MSLNVLTSVENVSSCHGFFFIIMRHHYIFRGITLKSHFYVFVFEKIQARRSIIRFGRSFGIVRKQSSGDRRSNHRTILALFDNICALHLPDFKCRNLT